MYTLYELYINHIRALIKCRIFRLFQYLVLKHQIQKHFFVVEKFRNPQYAKEIK